MLKFFIRDILSFFSPTEGDIGMKSYILRQNNKYLQSKKTHADIDVTFLSEIPGPKTCLKPSAAGGSASILSDEEGNWNWNTKGLAGTGFDFH